MAVLAACLLSGCGSHSVGGPDTHQDAAPLDSRLLYCEAPVGQEETGQRWSASQGAVVTGFLTDGGDAGVEIAAKTGSTVRAYPRSRPDYDHASRVLIHLAVDNASPEEPVEIEISFFDDLRVNRFWKVVRVTDPSWHTLEVDLPFLRYDRGRLPQWQDVRAWGMTFRDEASVRIRSIELWQDEERPSPSLGVDTLRPLFDEPDAVRTFRRGGFAVMTDAPDLRGEEVLDALVAMKQRMYARFDRLPEVEGEVPLLVFATDDGYRRFWGRVAERTGSSVAPLPQDAGYTWLGVATTGYSAEYGAVRPVYVHEASHALVERTLGIDAHRSWLFEGLANVDQLEVSNQEMGSLYRKGLTRPGVKMPVFELVSGQPIPTTRYWQATLLMQFLLDDPKRRAALDEAMAEMRVEGSADLRPWLRRHFGEDMPRFSASFWRWAWTTYG